MDLDNLKSELHQWIDKTIKLVDERVNKKGKIIQINKVMNEDDSLFYCIVELVVEAIWDQDDYGPSLGIVLKKDSVGEIHLLYDIIKSHGPYIAQGRIDLSRDNEFRTKQIAELFSNCINILLSSLEKEYDLK